jgi:DNA-binding transcriptional ArsR family regulator
VDVDHPVDLDAAAIAATIGEPARARMLYCLMDGHARTSTELSTVAAVSPSTASAHLARLKAARLVAVLVQGRYHYYRLAGSQVARVLESLNVLGGGVRASRTSRTPVRLRAARTCYDHIAGGLGVQLYERLQMLGLIRSDASNASQTCELSAAGVTAFGALGIDVAAIRAQRRRFAFGCLDWSERRPHLAGALGAALLDAVVRRHWVTRDLDGRALTLTRRGRQELKRRFGVELVASAGAA